MIMLIFRANKNMNNNKKNISNAQILDILMKLMKNNNNKNQLNATVVRKEVILLKIVPNRFKKLSVFFVQVNILQMIAILDLALNALNLDMSYKFYFFHCIGM